MRAHNRMRKPNGRRWTMLRTAVFAAYGRTCHLCGHGGANQVDHVIPVPIRPDLGWVLENLRPAPECPETAA